MDMETSKPRRVWPRVFFFAAAALAGLRISTWEGLMARSRTKVQRAETVRTAQSLISPPSAPRTERAASGLGVTPQEVTGQDPQLPGAPERKPDGALKPAPRQTLASAPMGAPGSVAAAGMPILRDAPNNSYGSASRTASAAFTRAQLDAAGGGASAGGAFHEGRSEELPPIKAATSSHDKKDEKGLSASLIKKEERKIQDVWEKYLDRSDTVKQYEKDWFSHPDLAALTDKYMENHNPVDFMRGLVNSPNFPKLAKKYMTSGAMLMMVKEMMSVASPEATSGAASMLAKDEQVGSWVQGLDHSVQSYTGFSMIAHALPAGDAQKLEEKKVDESKVSSNARRKTQHSNFE
ncbi:MAG: hypothetical protein HY059_22970 [Proteobacteria bacterium]|nr:hypothetical protein [Pseudomonadota bacterium]